MSSKSDLKVAHVRKRGSEKVMMFPKAISRGLPPGMLFGADTRVKIIRDGVPFDLNSTKLADRGVSLDDLADGDRVEIVSSRNFYEQLLLQDRKKSGVIVWMDADLRTALENVHRAPPSSTPEPVRATA